MSAKSRSGFTLIELMFVVAILGVLSVVAVASYTSYMKKARNQEAIAFLGDIKMKQETYFMTYSQYVDTAANTEDFFPVLNTVPDLWLPVGNAWDCASPLNNAVRGFCALGLMPKQEMTHFQYMTMGWAPGDALPAAGAQGPWIQNPARRWWFARARSYWAQDRTLTIEFRMNSELSEVVELTY
jgi:type IV pilus assembly protein PilE